LSLNFGKVILENVYLAIMRVINDFTRNFVIEVLQMKLFANIIRCCWVMKSNLLRLQSHIYGIW